MQEAQREEYESKNLGNFKKIYPVCEEESEKYNDFLEFSKQSFESLTGASMNFDENCRY